MSELDYFKERFAGINPMFLRVLSEDSRNVQERYARMLDYIQYNNPPYSQHAMTRELGIPQPSISRTLTRLRREANVRVRVDFDPNMIALKTVMIFYKASLIPYIPAVDWISSAWWTSEGTLFIYRVPPKYEEKLVAQVVEKCGKPTEVIGIKAMILAKPSIKYYFVNRDSLDPVTALNLAEQHPPIPPNVLEMRPGRFKMRFKDPRTLELISLLEHDLFEARKNYIAKHGFKLYTQQIKRVRKIVRGARIMFLDKDNPLEFLNIESDTRCTQDLIKIMTAYPYATNIGITDDDRLNVTLSMPLRYLKDVMQWVTERCGSSSRVYALVMDLRWNLMRQYIPWENFSKEKKYWEFDEVPKLTLSRLFLNARSFESFLGLYRWSVQQYLEYLRDTMGPKYMMDQISKLPLYIRKPILDIVRKMFRGKGGGKSGGRSKQGKSSQKEGDKNAPKTS